MYNRGDRGYLEIYGGQSKFQAGNIGMRETHFVPARLQFNLLDHIIIIIILILLLLI